MPNILSRLFARKGYGVQSPFAYHIVRDVAVEGMPFYAYDELQDRFGKRKDEGFLRLIFRVANEVHPHQVRISPALWSEALEAYILAGCAKVSVLKTTDKADKNTTSLILTAHAGEAEDLCANLTSDSCLIVADTRSYRALWKRICANALQKKSGTETGLLIFDCGRYAMVFCKERMQSVVYYI